MGFNMVKFWVQWRWNHPSEEEFFFDDIDHLMDIARQQNLNVMLNTVFDVAPAWIYRKYPDASMITLDGRKVAPQTQPHRQVGGLGYCLNHRGVMHHFFRFLRETVRRYTHHPALAMWNVGSEPELTSSMAELRHWAFDAREMGDALCYCSRCQAQFRKWLKKKYITIEKLNTAWNRNYSSFHDVEIPRTRNTFTDLIDWRIFFTDTLGQNVKKRFEVTQEEDERRHPVLCHHVPIEAFPVTSTANDPWNVGRYGDLHGITQMDYPMAIDVLRCSARGRPVIAAEMLMMPGYTLDVPEPIYMDTIKRFIFCGIAGNLKGFLFWQYRPEILGREAPAWGLTRLDGSSTPWLESLARVNEILQEHADFILDARPPRAQVAIVYNPENQIFAWASTGTEKTATDSIMGTFAALYEDNYVIDFLHPSEFGLSSLSAYRAILVPFPYLLSESMCRNLEEYVKRGGVLIGEAVFAGWNKERGHHEKTVPGHGLDRVFGVSQKEVAPVGREDGLPITISSDHPSLNGIDGVSGTLIRETFKVGDAHVLATFSNGDPAVTLHSWGEGKAVLVGSYVGLAYNRTGNRGSGALITGLVDMAVDTIRPGPVNKSRIRVDYLQTSENEMIVVRNLEKDSVKDTILLPELPASKVTELFSEKNVELSSDGGGRLLPVSLHQNEVQVWYG